MDPLDLTPDQRKTLTYLAEQLFPKESNDEFESLYGKKVSVKITHKKGHKYQIYVPMVEFLIHLIHRILLPDPNGKPTMHGDHSHGDYESFLHRLLRKMIMGIESETDVVSFMFDEMFLPHKDYILKNVKKRFK